jgi:hypothetical protein
MGRVSRLSNHAWQSLFMGSRLERYRSLLGNLKEAGYNFHTMSEFACGVDRGETFPGRVCLLRNDIDSDPHGAAAMFACDRSMDVRATYFFRLSTLDVALAREIASSGSEVGYHYEEIATVAKRLGLRSVQQIDAHMKLIRDEFRANFRRFAGLVGATPRIVASHGDFANRRIGIPNHYLLDERLMNDLGILADAYDPRLHGSLEARFSDLPAPQWWHPDDPVLALHDKPATISILVHPRQWTCNPALNFRLDAQRLGEEAIWRCRGATAAPQNVPAS